MPPGARLIRRSNSCRGGSEHFLRVGREVGEQRCKERALALLVQCAIQGHGGFGERHARCFAALRQQLPATGDKAADAVPILDTAGCAFLDKLEHQAGVNGLGKGIRRKV